MLRPSAIVLRTWINSFDFWASAPLGPRKQNSQEKIAAIFYTGKPCCGSLKECFKFSKKVIKIFHVFLYNRYPATTAKIEDRTTSKNGNLSFICQEFYRLYSYITFKDLNTTIYTLQYIHTFENDHWIFVRTRMKECNNNKQTTTTRSKKKRTLERINCWPVAKGEWGEGGMT